MQKVVRHLLIQIENKDSASLNSVVSHTNDDDQESAELSHTISTELDDGMRIQIAQELKSKIEQRIRSQKRSSGTQAVIYKKGMMDNSEQLTFLRIANRILQDNSIPNGLSMEEQGQTLLYMLQSRSKRNIA